MSLDSIETLLVTLAGKYPLLIIHVEELDPQVCYYVGKYISASKRNLHLFEINPDATWDAKPTKWPLKAITRVEVGVDTQRPSTPLAGNRPSRWDGRVLL